MLVVKITIAGCNALDLEGDVTLPQALHVIDRWLAVVSPLDSGRADQKLDRILAQGVQLLMATTDIKAAMARIDAATTAIAAKLADLASKVGTGMTDAEVAEVVAGLQDEATKLEGMGKDDPPVPAV